MASVLIVVGNYNGARLLPQCLPSLQSQTFPDCSVLVVDNCSPDDSVAVARSHGVDVLPMPINGGLGPAYNAGAAASDSDYIFFMNNDMRLDPRCIEELVRVLETHPDAFAADPLQWSWDGAPLLHAKTILRPGRWFGEIVPGFNLSYTPDAGSLAPVCWGCAGSLLVRRSMFEQLSGFDHTFFLNFEDVDLCWRAWRSGWTTWYVPSARLWHRLGSSQGAAVATQAAEPRGRKRPSPLALRVLRSGEKNRLRFVLKVMDRPYIARYVASLVVRWAGHLLAGRATDAGGIVRAVVGCLAEGTDIWRERRRLSARSTLDNAELYALWGDLGCLTPRGRDTSRGARPVAATQENR